MAKYGGKQKASYRKSGSRSSGQFPYWRYTSEQLSAMAKKQRRNPDGTFAKGFKSSSRPYVPKRKTFKAARRRSLVSYFGTDVPNTPEKSGRIVKENVCDVDIRVIGAPEEIAAVEEEIKSNFDRDELEDVSGQGITIDVHDMSKGGKNIEAGKYLLKCTEDNREQIWIDNDAIGDGETATHELTHLCRFKDSERESLGKSRIGSGDERCIDPGDISLEEALTVSETLARTNPEITKYFPGYYSHIQKDRENKISRERALEYKEKDIHTVKSACSGVSRKRKLYEKALGCFGPSSFTVGNSNTTFYENR